MRIVIDARIIGSSTGRYAKKLLEELEKIDNSNEYIVILKANKYDEYNPSAENFKKYPVDIRDYSFDEQIKFKSILENLNADLVHFCMPQQPILYKGKKICTVHDLTLLKTFNLNKNKYKYFIKQLIAKFVFKYIGYSNEFIITPSEYTKNEYIKLANVPQDKVRVIYESGIDSEEITNVLEYKLEFDKYILYVGQQSEYKNIKLLAMAHQLMLNTYPNLGLVLVGNLNEEAKKNKEYFINQGYKNIHFTGYLDDSFRNWLYKNAECYVFPSLMEGFGLPGLDAMAYNLTLISSNASCLPEIYKNAALYFDPNDVDYLVRKLELVISNKGCRENLIKNARFLLKNYSWKKTASDTLQLYKEALKSD